MSWETVYQEEYGCVSVQGNRAQGSDEFNKFLLGPVAARLNDTEGQNELLEHLQGLSLTGMGQNALAAVLAAETRETRDWAAGESLAEAVLESHHDVVLPWNNERDKRNPFASLPGADIVGFQKDGDSYRLALGEVKCSSEQKSPPQVMTGRSGMIHQIDTLMNDLGVICQLLKWLLPRVKKTVYESAFNNSCIRYFHSENRDLALFGILIRDQSIKESDLTSRAQTLAKKLQFPTNCRLIALYLPWPISQLPSAITQGSSV